MEKEDKVIATEFKASELFQIHLSIISRSAFAQQKWASASGAEEQKQMQAEVEYLTALANKIEKVLSNELRPNNG